jgi:hypothetical protein
MDGRIDTRIHGYTDTRIHGYTDTGLRPGGRGMDIGTWKFGPAHVVTMRPGRDPSVPANLRLPIGDCSSATIVVAAIVVWIPADL